MVVFLLLKSAKNSVFTGKITDWGRFFSREGASSQSARKETLTKKYFSLKRTRGCCARQCCHDTMSELCNRHMTYIVTARRGAAAPKACKIYSTINSQKSLLSQRSLLSQKPLLSQKSLLSQKPLLSQIPLSQLFLASFFGMISYLAAVRSVAFPPSAKNSTPISCGSG